MFGLNQQIEIEFELELSLFKKLNGGRAARTMCPLQLRHRTRRSHLLIQWLSRAEQKNKTSYFNLITFGLSRETYIPDIFVLLALFPSLKTSFS